MNQAIRAWSPDGRPAPSASVLWTVAILSAAALAWALWSTAWMCDDAYITLRTIDNFVNGYGLRWNIAERVQSYTHPAWLMLLTPFYALTREPYFTTLAIQMALSIATMLVLTRYVAMTPGQAAVAAAVFIGSKAMTDFSTSGLENPLTHAALAGVFIAFRSVLQGRRRLGWLAAFASIAILCRQDLILLLGPVLVYGFTVAAAPRVRPLVIGLAPAVGWHLFSLIYYGTLIPNTALAKLATGVPAWDLVTQGWDYWRATFFLDPMTVSAIAAGMAIVAVRRGRAGWLMCAGAALYALYLLRVGGDFMSGRFLTPILLWVVLGFAGLPAPSRAAWSRPRSYVPAIALVAAGLFITDPPPLISGPAFGADSQEDMVGYYGVADERRFYYPALGLRPRLGSGGKPAENVWAEAGKSVRGRSPVLQVIAAKNVGLFGYYAGPAVHVIDRHGLCDPLLARLPAMSPWRIGHFEREIPAGYLDGWRTGTNGIADPRLKAFYERIRLLTQGRMWSPSRWGTIVQSNLGQLRP